MIPVVKGPVFPFAASVGVNVTCDALKREVLGDLHERLGVEPLARRSDVLCSRNSSRVLDAPSVIHMQSAGVPVVLFLTRVDSRAVCLVVGRRLRPGFSFPKITAVHLAFSAEAFHGTVLAGELVAGGGVWTLLVDDVLAFSGNRVARQMFRDRHALGLMLLRSMWTRVPGDAMTIVMKKFFQVNQLDEAVREAARLPYRVRGFSLRSTGSARRDLFFALDVEQVRFRELRLRRGAGEDEYEIHVDDGGGSCLVQDIGTRVALVGMFADAAFNKWLAVPCEWNRKHEKWQPVPGAA